MNTFQVGGSPLFTHLPARASGEWVEVGYSGLESVDPGFRAQKFDISTCPKLTSLPEGLTPASFSLRGWSGPLPAIKLVHAYSFGKLWLSDCKDATTIPASMLNGVQVKLYNMPNLESLPSPLEANELTVENCPKLSRPAPGTVKGKISWK